MIFLHAKREGCKWLGNETLENLVLESMESEGNLPTPLSIRAFAIATAEVVNEDELKKKKIDEKSEETARAFADEIKEMSDDKILFLSFLFISDYFRIDFLKETYDELIGHLNLTEPWEFERCFKWFKDDKITISDAYLKFSHSSYSEALKYLLVKDGFSTRINREIFSKLLSKLAEKEEASRVVALTLTNNFNRLSDALRNELLLKLAEKEAATRFVALMVTDNFDSLSEAVRNELLLKLAEKDEAAWRIASVVADHFDILPESVRNLLFKLAEKDKAAEDVAKVVANNFDRLPEAVRDKLLPKLAEKDKVALRVTWIVADHFDRLSEAEKNELLLKLAEKDEAAWLVAKTITDNYGRLPEALRNLLGRLKKL